MDWIKDRTPTEEEQEQTDNGFIVCISGTAHNRTYNHAIEMKVYFEHGHWYDDDGWIDTETDDITVHGWMMPPSWEEGGNHMTLYELTNDLLTLQAEQENADIDDQVFRDTLEGLDGAFEDKCDGWAKWIRGMENDIKGMKEEEARLKLRRQRLETAVAKAKSTLSDYMRIVGKTKFKTALFNFGFRKSSHVVVLDATKAPEWALVPQAPKISLTAIKEHIDKGEDLNWAEVVETESLQIK